MPNKIHEFCSNCMEEIIKEPIMDEVEMPFSFEGIETEKANIDLERDVPVIRFFCSIECRNEFFVKPKMKEYEIWSEGYAATGEYGTATFHGKWKGETFDDAVKEFSKHYSGKVEPYTRSSFETDEYFKNRRSNWKIWGCALFDNEADARKSFG